MLIEPLGGGLEPLALASLPGLRAPAAVAVRGWSVVVADPVATVTDVGALGALGERCGWRQAPDPAAPPFAAGAVGYLSDDLSPAWLGLPPDHRPATAACPPLWFAVHDSAVCLSPGGEAFAVAADLPGLSQRPAAARVRRWAERVRAARSRRPAVRACRPEPRPTSMSLDAAAHAAAVGRAQEWIAAGDLYQLNVTLQVSRPWAAGGAALAARLFAASPGAGHAAWLSLPGGVDVVSISPETFLASAGDRVTTRPIKGTRPRRDDPAGDAREAAALRASTKDRAEHVMIVDLERNDLGRVCDIGSVRVPELAALERHPTVWHLTSTVVGRLRRDVGLGDLLAATFPAGSVTGAPKRMAWTRAARLEPVRRGIYCGAIGVVGRGLVDLSVAIRTAVVAGGRASYGTGGAIVADSVPADEFAEAMDKARAFELATAPAYAVGAG